MMTDQRTKIHWGVICVISLAFYFGPLLLVTALCKPVNKGTETIPGGIRFQAGQLALIEPELARSHPENRALLLAESLNRKIYETGLEEPTLRTKFKVANEQQLEGIFEDQFGEEGTALLERARVYNLRWCNPNLALFTLPNDPIPQKAENFGFVEITGGREKNRITTERGLNSILRGLIEDRAIDPTGPDKDPLQTTLELGVKTGKVSAEAAAQLKGTAIALNVKYRPEKNLFISQQNLPEFLKWQHIAQPAQIR